MRGRGWESFTVRELSFLKSMQKRSDPSFFLTKTTALHHGLLLGRITPASSISFRCSLTSSNCGGGILWNRSLNGGVSGSLRTILCSAALVWPMSCFSRKKISWYSFRRPRAFSACSVGQSSRPDKSNLSRSKSCHSASVKVEAGCGPLAEMALMTRGTKFAATILAIGVPFLISSQSLVLFLNTTGTLLLPVAKVV